MNVQGSGRFTLDKIDWMKIGTGLAVAIAGALAVYVPQVVGWIDWGQWTPVVMIVAQVVVNALRKFISDNQVLVQAPPAQTMLGVPNPHDSSQVTG